MTMRHLIYTALLCAAAVFLGHWTRAEMSKRDALAAGPPRRVPTALGEILAGRRTADHAGRWEATLELAENPPAPDQWPVLLDGVRTDPFASEQIIRAWIRDDPAACWAHLVSVGEGGVPPRKLAEVAALTWVVVDPMPAFAAIDALPVTAMPSVRSLAGDLRWQALREALSHDMGRAFPFVLSGLGATGVPFGSADTWVEQDPARACRLLASLPATSFRLAIGQAGLTWFQQDPKAALEWARHVPRGIQSAYFDSIAHHLEVSGDVESLKALALATPSMLIRSRVAERLFPLWIRDSPAAAFDWLAEHFHGPHSKSVAHNVMPATVGKLRDPADYSPLTALARRLPPGYARGGAVRAILGRWTREDPDAAIAYAGSLDPATRSIAYLDLAANWAFHPSAPEWLKTAPDIPIARSLLDYVIELGTPASLEELLPQLPPARAAVVRAALDALATGQAE
ncbi:hypothetical protein BH23VER1_BH23VER1_12860 [soil metagenome]